jgi:hypothetical protein
MSLSAVQGAARERTAMEPSRRGARKGAAGEKERLQTDREERTVEEEERRNKLMDGEGRTMSQSAILGKEGSTGAGRDGPRERTVSMSFTTGKEVWTEGTKLKEFSKERSNATEAATVTSEDPYYRRLLRSHRAKHGTV